MRIEKLEMVRKPNAYPMDLIVVPLVEKLIVSSKNNLIVAVNSQEDSFV